MQTGVRELVSCFNKIHLNQHAWACHSSANVERSTTTVKRLEWFFLGAQRNAICIEGLHFRGTRLAGDTCLSTKQSLKSDIVTYQRNRGLSTAQKSTRWSSIIYPNERNKNLRDFIFKTGSLRRDRKSSERGVAFRWLWHSLWGFWL